MSRCTRTWRTAKVDRGDTYLRHYFEFVAGDGRLVVDDGTGDAR